MAKIFLKEDCVGRLFAVCCELNHGSFVLLVWLYCCRHGFGVGFLIIEYIIRRLVKCLEILSIVCVVWQRCWVE